VGLDAVLERPAVSNHLVQRASSSTLKRPGSFCPAMAREYGVSKVVGDNFSGGVRADLVVRKQGTTYEATKRTRSDIYSEFCRWRTAASSSSSTTTGPSSSSSPSSAGRRRPGRTPSTTGRPHGLSSEALHA